LVEVHERGDKEMDMNEK